LILTWVSQVFLQLIALLLSAIGGGVPLNKLGVGKKYGTGGYIPASPGGQIIRVAEAGEGEYIIPEHLFDGLGFDGARRAEWEAITKQNAPAGGPFNVNVTESQPNITLAITNEGILVATEKAHRARVIKQGQ
jgi:hypothetical protein